MSMRIRKGDVRRLRTNDVVLVLDQADGYLTVAPAFKDTDPMVGRYLEYRGARFALDYTAKINYELVGGDFLFYVQMKNAKTKVGRDRPSKFKDVYDRMQLLTYINSMDDIRRVQEAEAK